RDGDDRHGEEDEPAAVTDENERIPANHDEFAIGEVDESHDPEDERESQRYERIDAAEADCVDHVLKERSPRGAFPRYAASISAEARRLADGPLCSTSPRCKT